MNPSGKKRKNTRQLQIEKLDHMLWLSTPLGKIMTTIKKQTQKIFPSTPAIIKYKPRAWVVRLPSAFIGQKRKNNGGFQAIVMAENEDQAWDEAAKCDEWEILDFSIEQMSVFPMNPAEDEICEEKK